MTELIRVKSRNELLVFPERRLAGVGLVLFDWSGVISDDRLPVYESNMRLLERYGRARLSFEDWLVASKANVVELLNSFGVFDDPKKLFGLYKSELDQLRSEGLVPTMYPDAKDVLHPIAQSNRMIAVVSTHPLPHLIREAQEYGVLDDLTEIHGNVPNKTDTINGIIHRFGFFPGETAFLGDMESDMKYANAANDQYPNNVFSVAVATGYHSRARLEALNPYMVVGSLTELLPHF